MKLNRNLKNKCPQCGLVFVDRFHWPMHKVTTDGPVSPMRCMTAEEMAIKGWDKNSAGVWGTKSKEYYALRVAGIPLIPGQTKARYQRAVRYTGAP